MVKRWSPKPNLWVQIPFFLNKHRGLLLDLFLIPLILFIRIKLKRQTLEQIEQ